MITDPGDPRWTAYILNELDREDRLELEAELARSPQARRHLAELSEAADLLGENLSAPSGYRLKRSQMVRLDRALAAQARIRSLRSLLTGGVLYKLAALLLLCATLAALLLPHSHRFGGALESSGDPDSHRLVSVPRVIRDAPQLDQVLEQSGAYEPPAYGLLCWSRSDVPMQSHDYVTATEDLLANCYLQAGDQGYRRLRRSLLQGAAPDPASVRVEELINYFPYDYSPPGEGRPVSVHAEVAGNPWNPRSRLLRVGLRGASPSAGLPVRIVLLLDSGEIQTYGRSRTAMLIGAITALRSRLDEGDQLLVLGDAAGENPAIRIEPGQTALGVLDSLASLPPGPPAGLEELGRRLDLGRNPEVRTELVIVAGQAGSEQARQRLSRVEALLEEPVPGAFASVLYLDRRGTTDPLVLGLPAGALVRAVGSVPQANHFWSEILERAHPVVAEDIHLQLRFDSRQVRGWRLVGHREVARLYRGKPVSPPSGQDLRAGQEATLLFEFVPYPKPASGEGEPLLSVDVNYREPGGESLLQESYPVADHGLSWWESSSDFRFCAAVAACGLLFSPDPAHRILHPYGVMELAQQGLGMDPHGHRREFLEVVRRSVRALGYPSRDGV